MGRRTEPTRGIPAALPAAALTAALPTGERLTYTTKFILPFIEHDWDCNPGYGDHPLIELTLNVRY